MIDIDWAMLAAAGLGGALTAGLFLGGLALGVRLALGFRWPLAALLVSAALRIGALLWVGWLVAAQGAWALAGFAAGFLIARSLVLAIARLPRRAEAPSCN